MEKSKQEIQAEIDRLEAEVRNLDERWAAGDEEAVKRLVECRGEIERLVLIRGYYPGMYDSIIREMRRRGYPIN